MRKYTNILILFLFTLTTINIFSGQLIENFDLDSTLNNTPGLADATWYIDDGALDNYDISLQNTIKFGNSGYALKVVYDKKGEYWTALQMADLANDAANVSDFSSDTIITLQIFGSAEIRVEFEDIAGRHVATELDIATTTNSWNYVVVNYESLDWKTWDSLDVDSSHIQKIFLFFAPNNPNRNGTVYIDDIWLGYGASVTENDVVPPGDFKSLSGNGSTLFTGAVDISFIAPGDDGYSGYLKSYEVRYSTSPITSDTEFYQSSKGNIYGVIIPVSGNSWDTITITDLDISTEYYFGIIAYDDAGNTTGFYTSTNTIKLKTSSNIKPGKISDLSYEYGTVLGEVILKFTAPGSDGLIGDTVQTYVVKYSKDTYLTEMSWNKATTLYSTEYKKVPPGEQQYIRAYNLLDGDKYYFAISAIDSSNLQSDVSNSIQVSPSTYFASVTVIDDFEDNDNRNKVNYKPYEFWRSGRSTVDLDVISADDNPDSVYGKNGYSAKISFNSFDGSAGTLIRLDMGWTNIFNGISFYIKGSAETIIIGLGFNGSEPKINLNYFLPQGLRSDIWQRVIIPMSTFTYNRSSNNIINFISIEFPYQNNPGEIYIDNIQFERTISKTQINNFNITTEQNALKLDMQKWTTPGEFDLYFNENFTSDSSAGCLRVNTGNGTCGIMIKIRGDVTYSDVLQFQIYSSYSVVLPNISVGLKTIDGKERVVVLSNYTDTTNFILGWDTVQIPIKDLLNTKSSPLENISFHIKGNYDTVYIDNVLFNDITPPKIPDNFKINGAVYSNNADANLTTRVVLTSDVESGFFDPTIAGVKYEYSTDNIEWYVVGTDKKTSKSYYEVVWNLYDLYKNNVNKIYLRATSIDVADNFSTTDIFLINTTIKKENVIVYPNPFNPYSGTGWIHFINLPYTPTVEIFNLAGEYIEGSYETGRTGELLWDGRNGSGHYVANGLYFYVVTKDNETYSSGKFVIKKIK